MNLRIAYKQNLQQDLKKLIKTERWNVDYHHEKHADAQIKLLAMEQQLARLENNNE